MTSSKTGKAGSSARMIGDRQGRKQFKSGHFYRT
jgi:hypothetical protein